MNMTSPWRNRVLRRGHQEAAGWAASFAAGAMGDPVAADIFNQANPEKQP
jgi:hypothetical protein